MSDQADKPGEKALRIGVIQGVRVVEERILRKAETVTFGTGAKNTFSLASSDLPESVTLFEAKGGTYELQLTEALSGRLEEPSGKKDFAAIRAKSPATGGVWKVPITNEGKGRIRLSPEITVLFHFVVPPPVAAAVATPPELKGNFLKAFEPIFTAVLTASFLVHFVIGLYVRITEPVVHSDVDDFKELVERIQPPRVDVKPIVSTPKPNTDVPTTGPGPAETPTKGSGSGSGSGESGGGGGEAKGKGKGTGGGGGIGDRNAIREGIAGKGILQLIGGRGGGGGGGAVGSVFGAGGSVSDDIGGALAGTAGVGIAGGAGGGDGVTRRGTGGGGGGGDGSGGEGGGALGIGDLGTGASGGKGPAAVDTGTKAATRVVARVRADDIEAVDGSIDKKVVGATIRRRQDGFQACYETALKSNSKLGGKLVVEFTIGEGGKVIGARVIKDGLNSGEVSTCVINLLKRLRFPDPNGEVTISNAFVFSPGG